MNLWDTHVKYSAKSKSFIYRTVLNFQPDLHFSLKLIQLLSMKEALEERLSLLRRKLEAKVINHFLL